MAKPVATHLKRGIEKASEKKEEREREKTMATGVGSLGFAGKARQVVRMRIDSHVHVWAPKDQASKYPFAGSLAGSSAKNEPPMPGHASILLDEMAKAKVDKAVIIQPGNHLYDHSYVNSVLKEVSE